MSKPRKATFKQKAFVREYIKNKGNGTQAALKVYDANTPKAASVIATENLEKLSVQEQLSKELAREELSLQRFTSKLSDIARSEPVKGYTGGDIMDAVKTGLKLHGVLADKKHVTSVNVNADLSKLSKYELVEMRRKRASETEAILDADDL